MKKPKTAVAPITKDEFCVPTAIVRLTKYYRPGLEHERIPLYEATRAHWSIKKDQRILDTKFALAVHDKKVLEVYEIAGWFKANSTMMTFRMDPGEKSRYEFVGNIAKAPIRNKFIGRSIDGLIPRGNIRPVVCFGM